MHANQYTFRKGRSTESAISDTVDYLESKVLRGGFAIGVFLDIEGTFNNLLLVNNPVAELKGVCSLDLKG
jgi:hypothetical protein